MYFNLIVGHRIRTGKNVQFKLTIKHTYWKIENHACGDWNIEFDTFFLILDIFNAQQKSNQFPRGILWFTQIFFRSYCPEILFYVTYSIA